MALLYENILGKNDRGPEATEKLFGLRNGRSRGEEILQTGAFRHIWSYDRSYRWRKTELPYFYKRYKKPSLVREKTGIVKSPCFWYSESVWSDDLVLPDNNWVLGANPTVPYKQDEDNGPDGDFDYVLTVLSSSILNKEIFGPWPIHLLCSSFKFNSSRENSYESARVTQGVEAKL